jgi:hypothetical protein
MIATKVALGVKGDFILTKQNGVAYSLKLRLNDLIVISR